MLMSDPRALNLARSGRGYDRVPIERQIAVLGETIAKAEQKVETAVRTVDGWKRAISDLSNLVADIAVRLDRVETQLRTNEQKTGRSGGGEDGGMLYR